MFKKIIIKFLEFEKASKHALAEAQLFPNSPLNLGRFRPRQINQIINKIILAHHETSSKRF